MADAADFDRQMAAQNARGEEILWHEVPNENILVEGLGFFAEERRWNRLPQSLSGMLQAQRPALIELSSHMAGACLRFRTDSRAVWVKAAVNAAPYMAHMTPAAQCGCDCYLRALPDMAWQFAGLTKFSPQEDSFCCELARDLPPHTEVLVYLPLYIGIRSIAIGLEKGAQMQPALPRKHRRTIAFYGTSITQGGCASRPGMAYPAILSRELDREVYNLGFSGNGVGMSGLASCFCSLPRLGALVVDIQPNAGPRGCWKPTCQPFWMRCAAVRRSCRFWCFRQAGRQNAAGTAPKRNSLRGKSVFSSRRWNAGNPGEIALSGLHRHGICWKRLQRKPPWTASI